MLQFEKRQAKRVPVGRLRQGDVIFYKEKPYIFDRIPQGAKSIYVVCLETIKSHKIPIYNGGESYYDVIGHRMGGIKQVIVDTDQLESGDLFAIDHHQKGSFIYRFERYTPNAIIAINPMNNKEVRISKQFTCTKIDNLPF